MLFIHFKTLFSFSFYRRLIQLTTRQTVGFVGYLFVLSLLVFFFFTGALLRQNVPLFLKNFPQVTFEKGTLTAPDHPVVASIPETNFKLVFDASAQMPPSNQELLDQNTLMWIHQNQLYIPSANGLQQHTLPPSITFTATPEVLAQYQSRLLFSIQLTMLFFSFLLIGLMLLVDFMLALGVVLFFNVFRHTRLPKAVLLKLACFVLGPMVTLWIIRLWVPIPLFGLAQLLLCIIYVQQIFNSFTETPYEN